MFLAKRFVAGTTIAAAVAAVHRLNEAGMTATLDFLGEDITSLHEAEQTKATYSAIIQEIARTSVRTNLSVKMTALGLHIDPDRAQQFLDEIIAEASVLEDPFVRIDMERASDVDATLASFSRAFAKSAHVGPVLQAYLRRTPDDLEKMIALGARVRLCKGAYDEPVTIAHTDSATIRRVFLRLAEALLERGRYPGIATHDPGLIATICDHVKEHDISPDTFEFQMLYGVRPSLQRSIVEQGYRLRIYVPFGTHWLGYFRRRISERRANAFFALSALFSR